MNSLAMSRFALSLLTANCTEGLSSRHAPSLVSVNGYSAYENGLAVNASDWLSRLAVPDAVSAELSAMGISPSKNLRISAL